MLGESKWGESRVLFGGDGDGLSNGGAAVIPVSSDFGSTSSSSGSPLSANYIEHRVSRFDTLAGIAIKYGVEVADIRRMNGLVTDLQMFAHKTLQIPLPGRHPPSSCRSKGSVDDRKHTPPRRPRSDVLDLLESLNLKPSPQDVSPAMSSLQGYYGLPPVRSSPVLGGIEMAVRKTARNTLDNALMQTSDLLSNKQRKSRSIANGFLAKSGENDEEKSLVEATDKSDNEKYFRSRQRADAGFRTPEKLLKEDNSSGFSVSAGKGLALRPKSGSRTDMDSITNGDSVDSFVMVRKSSSTSSLQDSENSPSVWLTNMWPLKVDSRAKPIFDGLPNPISVWWNKTARD